MKAMYADPPYLGCAAKLYGDPTYDSLDKHIELMERMEADSDSWALSLHEPSLRLILPHAPQSARVAAWVKPFASFKPGVDPAYTWEPVIFKTARKASKERNTVRDHVSCPITLKRGLAGAKPKGFCFWLFDLLGLQPGDEFVDIFPGTRAVSNAWVEWCREPFAA